MKWTLLLAVALWLQTNEVRSDMACFQGQKMKFSVPIPGSNSATDVTCSGDADACLVVKMNLAISGMSGKMEVGSCVPDVACSSMTCDRLQSTMEQNMPSIPGMNMKISGCEVTCGQPASAAVVASQMPVLPINPGNQPEADCNLPMWNLKVKENVIHFSGIRRSPKPKFILNVKGTRRGYRPGKEYKIVIRATSRKLQMTGFYVTLHNTSSTSCSLGSFKGDRRRIAGAPQVRPGCTQPLVSQSPSMKKITGAKWVAPEGCDDLGEVEIRAEVRGVDGNLYRDLDATPPQYRKLTKVIRLRPKKKNGKKNKRRRQ